MENRDFIERMEALRDQSLIVELSYPMEKNMPSWPTQPQFESTVCESYETGGESFHCGISMSEHTGTHIDAPKHFIPKGCPVDELDPKAVMGRGVVIHGENAGPLGLLTLEQIKDFEAREGEIKAGDIVMIRFGWDERYAIKPEDKGYLRDWPGLSQEGAAYLADKKVAAVGCDTLALDVFGASEYICHQILLGRGIPIIENICNLSKLPAFSYVIGLPQKFKGGSGSPIRLIAMLPSRGQACQSGLAGRIERARGN